MYNPIKNSPTLPCYGQFGIEKHCSDCIVKGYCIDSKKSNRIESAFCGAGQYSELLSDVTVEEPPSPERSYSHDELKLLVSFFLDLTPTQFMIIKLKTLHPDMEPDEISSLLKINMPNEIRKFFNEICQQYPSLKTIINIAGESRNFQST